MGQPVQLVYKGQPTDIWRIPDGANALAFTYILPLDTIGGRQAHVATVAEAANTSLWAMRIMATKAVNNIRFYSAFQSAQNDKLAHNRDGIAITYSSPDHAAAERLIESMVCEFWDAARAPGVRKFPLSLINTQMEFEKEEFDREVEELAKTNPPHVALLKALINRFNLCVAGPDGGEVRLADDLANHGTTDGVVSVRLFNTCAGCSASSLTVGGKLQRFLQHHAPNTAQKLVIAS